MAVKKSDREKRALSAFKRLSGAQQTRVLKQGGASSSEKFMKAVENIAGRSGAVQNPPGRSFGITQRKHTSRAKNKRPGRK